MMGRKVLRVLQQTHVINKEQMTKTETFLVCKAQQLYVELTGGGSHGNLSAGAAQTAAKERGGLVLRVSYARGTLSFPHHLLVKDQERSLMNKYKSVSGHLQRCIVYSTNDTFI